MDMNVLLSTTKSLFTDSCNTVEASILLEKEKTIGIFISYIFIEELQVPGDDFITIMQRACFKNTFCSYSEGKK